MYYFSKAFRFWFLKLEWLFQALCGDETCLIRDYLWLGVKNYSGKVEVRVENYFRLDVVSHPNQQILGHWPQLAHRYLIKRISMICFFSALKFYFPHIRHRFIFIIHSSVRHSCCVVSAEHSLLVSPEWKCDHQRRYETSAGSIGTVALVRRPWASHGVFCRPFEITVSIFQRSVRGMDIRKQACHFPKMLIAWVPQHRIHLARH